jgi:hypothetical protein
MFSALIGISNRSKVRTRSREHDGIAELSALLVRLQGIVDVESLERIRWIDGCPTLHINRLVGRGDCSSCVCWAGRFERRDRGLGQHFLDDRQGARMGPKFAGFPPFDGRRTAAEVAAKSRRRGALDPSQHQNLRQLQTLTFLSE